MRRANGQGTIVKLKGNRRRPYAVRKIIGWKEDGRPKVKYISYHKTHREAEQALNRYNEDPYTISKVTLAELYKDWIASQELKRAPKTIQSYQTSYNHLEPFYDVKMRDIDRLMLTQFYERLDVPKNSLNKVVQLLNMLFKYAVKRGILPLSALNINKVIEIPDKEERHATPRSVITTEEINRLWELSPKNEYAKIILVYIYTGLRYSELQDLLPEDCHEDYIEIRHAKTAAGIRIVPLADKVKKLLPIIKASSKSTYDRRIDELIPGHTAHDTRYTCVTLLTEAGVDPRIIKAIVGHKTGDITDHYTKISLEAKLKAINKI